MAKDCENIADMTNDLFLLNYYGDSFSLMFKLCGNMDLLHVYMQGCACVS